MSRSPSTAFPREQLRQKAGTATGSLDVTDFVVDSPMVVLALRGALDMDSCPILQARLARALTLYRPPLLAIGLNDLTSIDSFGLTVLLATGQHVQAVGGRLVVFAADCFTLKTFRDRGLYDLLDVRPTLAEAVRELRASQRNG
ncbi:STAS domain-containing protein [Nonomuraea jabiensis]|uniref:STAS domain-containing protein n=1 Tax=Nonomuraea jabiensis TaxID=882448 RepID=UPI0036CA2C21